MPDEPDPMKLASIVALVVVGLDEGSLNAERPHG
jgi:hypothetical protein